MIVKFYNRCLEALETLFGFEGAISRTSSVDMGPPMLVVDVSRMAMAAQGFFGIVPVSGTTAGAGVPVYDAADPLTVLRASDLSFSNNMQSRNLADTEVDVWVVGVSASATAASAGNISNVVAGIEIPNLSPAHPLGLKIFQAGGGDLVSAGRVMLITTVTNAFAYGDRFFPFLMPPRATLNARFTDNAGGALSATVLFHVWVAPKGTFPPTA